MPTTLLVAHPKPVIRAGLRSMLTDSQVKTVGEAGDAPSALTLANKNKPTVVLIDAAIPGGDAFDLAGGLLKALPATKVVFVTEIDNPTYTARARAAGAANCLLMGFSQRELLAAIESAAAGRPAAGAGNFGRITASLAAREKGPALNAGLTPREGQVLAHVAFGLSNDEIARSLEISVETVKEHVQHLLRKLAVNDRTQAAVWAVKSGLCRRRAASWECLETGRGAIGC